MQIESNLEPQLSQLKIITKINEEIKQESVL